MILLRFIEVLFQVYFLMIFIRIVVSWVPEWRGYQFIRFISYYTDPYLNFFRKFIPPIGMIDVSPIVAFLALGFIQRFITHIILRFLL